MNFEREILFLNRNYDIREFDVFVNGKKIPEKRDLYKKSHKFTTSTCDNEVKIVIRQKHSCESALSMLEEWTKQLLLDFLFSESNNISSRAVFEGEINESCSIINVELVKCGSSKECEYIFNVYPEEGEIKVYRNEFESPEFLKKRMKILKMLIYALPIGIPIIIIAILIVTFR